MTTVTDILNASNWASLGVPKTKASLRDLQFTVHPDRCSDPRAGDAFASLQALYDGPDFSVRVADGYRHAPGVVLWKLKSGFADLADDARGAQSKLAKLPKDFKQFYTTTEAHPDGMLVTYGPGAWFLRSFGNIDGRTSVWVAKRLAASIVKAAEQNVCHGDINVDTVVLLPQEHGLKLDGFWSAVRLGKPLSVRPTAKTPPRYLGGSATDENLMVAQAAGMLTSIAQDDNILLKTYKKHSLGNTNAREFFHDVESAAKKTFGANKFHILDNPKEDSI